MYAARPDILRLTRRDQLDDDYFTQTLLPDYMAEHPNETAEWDVVYDARGHFAEPHTDRLISLGTINVRGYLREVATYAPPRPVEVVQHQQRTEPSTDVGDGDIATLRLNGADDEELYLLRQARVELNAFTSDQFVVWLESKLKEHGVTKVVPDDAALELAYRRSIAARYFEDHAHDLIEAARRHAAAADLLTDLRSRMEQALQTDPARSWHAVLRGLWP